MTRARNRVAVAGRKIDRTFWGRWASFGHRTGSTRDLATARTDANFGSLFFADSLWVLKPTLGAAECIAMVV